jgi:hypothetical protein
MLEVSTVDILHGQGTVLRSSERALVIQYKTEPAEAKGSNFGVWPTIQETEMRPVEDQCGLFCREFILCYSTHSLIQQTSSDRTPTPGPGKAQMQMHSPCSPEA